VEHQGNARNTGSTLAFTRMLGRPGRTIPPGGFINRQPSQFKGGAGPTRRCKATRVGELAMFIVILEPVPWLGLRFRPANYKRTWDGKYLPGMDFLKGLPNRLGRDPRSGRRKWGKYVVEARRNGKKLVPGRDLPTARARGIVRPAESSSVRASWKVTLWEDAPDAGQKPRNTWSRAKSPWARPDTLPLKLAPSGGKPWRSFSPARSGGRAVGRTPWSARDALVPASGTKRNRHLWRTRGRPDRGRSAPARGRPRPASGNERYRASKAGPRAGRPGASAGRTSVSRPARDALVPASRNEGIGILAGHGAGPDRGPSAPRLTPTAALRRGGAAGHPYWRNSPSRSICARSGAAHVHADGDGVIQRGDTEARLTELRTRD